MMAIPSRINDVIYEGLARTRATPFVKDLAGRTTVQREYRELHRCFEEIQVFLRDLEDYLRHRPSGT